MKNSSSWRYLPELTASSGGGHRKWVIKYPLAGLMVQAINHSTEHRTQISTIITQLGLTPPEVSGCTYVEEQGQLKDLSKGEPGT